MLFYFDLDVSNSKHRKKKKVNISYIFAKRMEALVRLSHPGGDQKKMHP